MSTLAEAILATTPQDVYDKLVTMDPNMAIWMDQPCQCALHLFFTDVYPDLEGIVIQIEDVRIEEEEDSEPIWVDLPPWMHEFQTDLIELFPSEARLQDILDYLEGDYHVET